MIDSQNAAIRTAYSGKVYQSAANWPLLGMIPQNALRVLDVGCGGCENILALTQRGHVCVGITVSREEAIAARSLDLNVLEADCTEPLPLASHAFDAIVLSHVLEHFAWPESVLRSLMHHLDDGGRIYVAVPNIAFFLYRWRLLRGQFPREPTGIFDETHLRWFTLHTIQPLSARSGFDVAELGGDMWFRDIRLLPKWVGRLLVRLWPNFFSKQLRFVLTPSLNQGDDRADPARAEL